MPNSRLATAKVYRAIRRSDWFRALIPMEAALGWPSPKVRLRSGSPKVYLEILCFSTGEESGRTVIFEPVSTIVVDPYNMALVSYLDHRFERPWTHIPKPDGPIGAFPHGQVAALSKADYVALRERTFAMYDTLFGFVEGGQVPSTEFVDEFRDLLGTVVEPSLLPYLQHSGPNFAAEYLQALNTLGGDQ